MASPTSTFATLKALHLVIADALEDIQRVYSHNSLSDTPSPQCSSPVYPSSPGPSPDTSPFPTTPPLSFPPTPLSATFPSPPYPNTGVPFIDYPSPDSPFIPDSPSEQLALHPDAAAAASRIVAACGQMSHIVHKPFLSLCDAIMSYNLPACMRLVEHLHIAEIIREAEDNRQRRLAGAQQPALLHSAAEVDLKLGSSGPVSTTLARASGTEWTPVSRVHKRTARYDTTWFGLRRINVLLAQGLHVADITNVICFYAGSNYVDPSELVHVLRLLSTHHIFRETVPDTFALTRVASLLDSGKSVKDVFSSPETKYDDTGGTPAFVALTTDELFKSAAYLTEAFTGVQLPPLTSNPNPSIRADAVLSKTTATPPTSGYIANDPVHCASTTRSSSILTHTVYPENEGARPPSRSLPLTGLLENDRLYSLPMIVPMSSELLAASPLASPLAHLSPAETSTQREKECPYSGDAVKPEKLLAFNLAFRTHAPLFEWLENGGEDLLGGAGHAAGITPTEMRGAMCRNAPLAAPSNAPNCVPRKSFRLKRFSKAMMATTDWEAPKAILSGFDWHSLPKGSTIVDVGGGIGSTTMILARALNDPGVDSLKKQDGANNEGPQSTSAAAPRHRSKLPSDPSLMANDEPPDNTATPNDGNLRFVVQDKHVVTVLGVEAWRSKCPEMLESGQVIFQDQDFFEPQPHFEPPHLTRHPAVYLLRVILHDWPDELARRILINLRVASNPETRLVIAEHVLPLACIDEDVLDGVDAKACKGSTTEEWTLDSVLASIEGAERTLVPPPLLSNLGKASASAYWMDLIMHVSLNGKERTLREFCALALSAGWRITRMTRPEGSLFAYLVCEPIILPDDAQATYNAVLLSSELSTVVIVPSDEPTHHTHVEPSRHKPLPARPLSLLPSATLERSLSRCGTPTFGSRILLPNDEELQSPRSRGAGAAKKWFKSKGLGVRSVTMEKVERQRQEQTWSKGALARDNNDGQSGIPASPSHMRVWWKKSPPNSTSNSSVTIHKMNGEVPEHRTAGQERRGTLKSGDRPSTPSPRALPNHHNWPSTESNTPPMPGVIAPGPRTRRRSVASITRKLSFATFGRRPSIADITEPLPTPPPSAALTELAPPPILKGDTGRSLKHLPSLPTLGRGEVSTRTTAEHPAIPRRPSLSFAGQVVGPLQPVLKSAVPRRPDVMESSKSGILKSHTRPYERQQSSPDVGCPAEPTPTPRHQRRVTLSNAPGALPSTLAQIAGSMSVPPDHTGADVKRIPNVPKLPRRLSIPMLRRKQSRAAVQDTENRS